MALNDYTTKKFLCSGFEPFPTYTMPRWEVLLHTPMAGWAPSHPNVPQLSDLMFA